MLGSAWLLRRGTCALRAACAAGAHPAAHARGLHLWRPRAHAQRARNPVRRRTVARLACSITQPRRQPHTQALQQPEHACCCYGQSCQRPAPAARTSLLSAMAIGWDGTLHPCLLYPVPPPLCPPASSRLCSFQPAEAIYAKVVVKRPGLDMVEEVRASLRGWQRVCACMHALQI